jgi:hypothetical protein
LALVYPWSECEGITHSLYKAPKKAVSYENQYMMEFTEIVRESCRKSQLLDKEKSELMKNKRCFDLALSSAGGRSSQLLRPPVKWLAGIYTVLQPNVSILRLAYPLSRCKMPLSAF